MHRHFHVFVSVEGSSKVHVFDVGTTKFGTRCADDTIPHYLGRYHVGCVCGELVGVVDEVATNGNAHTVRIVFLWAMIDDNACVGDKAIRWDVSDFVV